jgi:hypothetical protein
LDPQTAKHEVENLMLAPERESLKLHGLEIGKLVQYAAAQRLESSFSEMRPSCCIQETSAKIHGAF